MIHLKLIKTAADSIAEPLKLAKYSCLFQEIFLDNNKTASLVPPYKRKLNKQFPN